MTVEIKHDFSLYNAQVVAVWAENSNPAAEKGRIVLEPPHLPGAVMLVEGLRRTVYQFKFYLSSDGESLETLLHSWFIDAAKIKSTSVEFHHYIVDRGNSELDGQGNLVWADPVSASDQLIDKRLDGETFEVSHRMIGIRPKSSYIVLPNGGFGLVDGEVFEHDDHWVAIVTREVEVSVPESTGGDTAINIVSADETFGPAYQNKKNIAAFETTIGTTTFPAFSSITDCVCRFSTYSGTQRYWRLQFAEGDDVRFMGEDRNHILLATNEMIELTIKAGVCYVTGHDTRYRTAGQIIGGGKQLIGTLLADGAGGLEYNVSDYARMIEELEPAQTCSYLEYDQTEAVGTFGQPGYKVYYKNRGKFAISANGLKFKFPDLRGYSPRFLKVIGGFDASRFSSGPMSFQKEGVNLANIEIELHDGEGGSSTNPIRAGNGGNRTGFSGMDQFRAWENNKVNGVAQWVRFTHDGETRSDNYGQLPLIVL